MGITTSSSTLKSDLIWEYDTSHQERGYALIINNRRFHDGEVRLGSEKDVESIAASLRKLEFKVHVREDCSSLEMKNEMLKYATMNHSSCDYFLCVMMSHGNTDQIIGVDGSVNYIKELIDPFKHNPTLKGKPKLFFINSCRGSTQMIAHDGAAAAANRAAAVDRFDRERNAAHDSSTRKIPMEADVFIHYSTVTGYVSYRDEKKGSWFIESLAHVLDKKGQSLSLNQLVMAVNNRVAEHYNNQNKGKEFKQTPNVDHTLRKEVYFKPKQKKSSKKAKGTI
jgi:caspase 7